ncbi:MAG: hypothetical protein WD070_03280 [Pirellulaceae bacterium]
METELLASLIDNKYEVLSSLKQLAIKQMGIVQEGGMTRLMKLLAKKQLLLNQLDNLERELDPFRSQNPESRRWSSPRRRQQTRDRATLCESLLSEVMQLEKQCEDELVVRRDAVAHRLQRLHSVTQATDAYMSNAPIHNQLDLSSDT